MAPKPAPLSEIQLDIPKDKGFLVRVIRLWFVPQRNDANDTRTIEMVLQDDQEVRIQATIDVDIWDHFKDKIEEHGLYGMKNFRVEPNVENYKPASHPYRLYFHRRTGVKPFDLHQFPKFPRTLYSLKSIDDLFSNVHINTSDLIDFIRALVPRSGVRIADETENCSRHVSFNLHDVGMKKIYCTLWEGYGDEAIAKFPQPRNDPIIVLIQLCRIKKGADGSIALNTSFHVSKVIIDEHLPEIEDFRIRFLSGFRHGSQPSTDFSSSDAMSTSIGPVEKIEVLKDREPTDYWFYATIRNVLSRDNWCYSSCPNFRYTKKVTRVGDEFLCPKCHKKTKEPVYKYNMKFSVHDGDSSTTIHMWDDQCTLLIGKTTIQLRSEVEKCKDHKHIPNEILAVDGKSFLFKISTYTKDSRGARTYTIHEFSVDPVLIELHKPENEAIVEVYDSNDDLDLMFANDTQVDSNAPPDSITEINGDAAHTPSSKRRMDDDGDSVGVTPTSQNSSTKKLKGVKIEK